MVPAVAPPCYRHHHRVGANHKGIAALWLRLNASDRGIDPLAHASRQPVSPICQKQLENLFMSSNV